MSPRGKRVTASEVGLYAFCAHAWWLSVVEKHKPADMGALARGVRVHERHGWQVALARGARRVALVLVGAAVVTLLVWALVSLL